MGQKTAMPCSSQQAVAPPLRSCWVPCVWNSPIAPVCSSPTISLSLGLWTSRCSSPPTIRMTTMWQSATPSGPPCTTRSPCRPRIGSTPSTRIRNTPCLIPTTSCATVTKWAAVPCVSTVMTFRIVCSMCSASLLKRLPTSSASCLKPSSTALRRTLASLSVGIVPPPSWLAPTPSATSSPSRRLAAVVIR